MRKVLIPFTELPVVTPFSITPFSKISFKRFIILWSSVSLSFSSPSNIWLICSSSSVKSSSDDTWPIWWSLSRIYPFICFHSVSSFFRENYTSFISSSSREVISWNDIWSDVLMFISKWLACFSSLSLYFILLSIVSSTS